MKKCRESEIELREEELEELEGMQYDYTKEVEECDCFKCKHFGWSVLIRFLFFIPFLVLFFYFLYYFNILTLN